MRLPIIPALLGGLAVASAAPAQAATTERVSVATGGAQAEGEFVVSDSPSVSGDGRFVAFSSLAADLVPGDTNAAQDVLVRGR